MERIISQDFKETEIGLISKDWEVVRLEEIASIRNETIHPEYALNEIYVGLEHIIPSQIKLNNWGNSSEVKSTKNIFYKGDILYGKLRPYLDKSVICDMNGICSTDIIVLKSDTDIIDNIFLAYIIHHDFFIKFAIKTMTGVNHPRTSWSKLKHLSIPLPPLPEQKAIANVLSAVQENIEKTEAVINSTKELKKSLMNQLFTYGPVPINETEKVKLKETEVGLIPEDWDVVRLEEMAKKMKSGGTPRRNISEYWGGNIPFVLIEDMTNTGLYLTETKENITEKGLNNSNAWLVPPNSLLLSMYATIGETTINRMPLTTNQAILAIIPDVEFNIEYAAYMLKYHSERLKMQNIQSTQKNVNKGIVEKFLIPLPPFSIQKQIADILSAVDAKIEAEENKVKALEKLFQSLLNDLMTGKIRVREELA